MENQFYGSAPVLYVKDLHRSLDFYCDTLGFDRPDLWGDPPDFAMPKREDMIVMLSQQKDHTLIQPKKNIWDIYFWVRDARQLYYSFKEKGAVITQELMLKEAYKNLEFIVQDPDGYTIAFGQGIDEDAFFGSDQDDEQADTKFLYLSPVLASSDVARDIAWYENKLGFKNVFDSTRYSDGPVDYAVLGRQELYFHLQFQFQKDMTSTDIKFQVKNIDPLFQEYLDKKIITADRMHRKTAWGTNEFGLFDPSKNRITFFEDI